MKQVTIKNGQSTTEMIALGGSRIVGILVPAAWTAADLSLEGSMDGANFTPMFDAAGEQMIVRAAASRYVVLSGDATDGVSYCRLRSGTSTAPVNQAADRALMLDVSR